jgi:hypothetical protein
LVPLYIPIHSIQQGNMAVQLVSDLDTQLMLAADRLTKLIQLIILVPHDLVVVEIDLLIGHIGLVDGRGRLIAIRPEKMLAVAVFFLVDFMLHGCGGC